MRSLTTTRPEREATCGICDLWSDVTGCRPRDRRLGLRGRLEPGMPFYHAHVRPGLLDLAGRSAFERRRRGALWCHRRPTPFVHVMITEDSDRCPRARTADLEHDPPAAPTNRKPKCGAALRPSGPAGRCRCHDDLSHRGDRGVVHDGGRCAAARTVQPRKRPGRQRVTNGREPIQRDHVGPLVPSPRSPCREEIR